MNVVTLALQKRTRLRVYGHASGSARLYFAWMYHETWIFPVATRSIATKNPLQPKKHFPHRPPL